MGSAKRAARPFLFNLINIFMQNLELNGQYRWFGKTFNKNIPFFTIVDYNDYRNYVLETIYKNTLTIIDASQDPFETVGPYNELQALGLSDRVVLLTSNYYEYTDYNNILFFPFHLFRSRHFYKKIDINNKRKYKVSCLNRNPHTHKIYTFFKLQQLATCHEMLISFNNIIPYGDMPVLSMDSEIITDMPDEIKKKISSINLYRQDIPNDDFFNVGNLVNHNKHPAFNDTYLNIVTETTYKLAFLSEKTFKPLISGQLMAFSSAPHTLSAVKKIGFETFDDVINPYYDEISDMYSRIDLMIDEVTKIYHNIEELYHANKEKIEFNQIYFLSDEIENKFLAPLIDIGLFK